MQNKHRMDSPKGRLKTICKEKRITQKEFADLVGMSLRGFATVLSGKVKVSKTLALAVEAQLGYKADWILTGEGPRLEENLKNLSYWERLVLDVTKDSDRRIAEQVCLWLDSKAGPKKFSFDERDAWGDRALSRYEELMTEIKKILNQMLGHPDGTEKQATFRGMLLILYFGEDEFDSEDDESHFFFDEEDQDLERIKEIRSELEELIGDGLKG